MAASPLYYDELTKTSAHLSIVEVAIGSFVHGLKIPFGGHSLSLNQGFFLARHTLKLKSQNADYKQSEIFLAPIEISAMASILKSLSPAGQKIGPMLSISMQGFLFSLGLVLGFGSRLGLYVGLVLLSLWAFVQPLMTLYIIHGNQLEKIIEFYFLKLQDEYPQAASSAVFVLALLVVVKMALALVVAFYVQSSNPDKLDQLENKLIQRAARLGQNIKPTAPEQSTYKKILSDLTKPLFLFSMFLLVGFLLLTETSYVKIFWLSLRPLATALVLFYLIRSTTIANILEKLSKKNVILLRLHQQARKTRLHIDAILSDSKTK